MTHWFTTRRRIIAAASAAVGLSAGIVPGQLAVRAAVGDVGYVAWEQPPGGGGGGTGGGGYACAGEIKINHNTSGAEAIGEAGCTIVVDTLAYKWTWKDMISGQVLAVFSGSANSTATLSTSSQTNLGTDGQRAVRLCITSVFQGVSSADNCTEVGNV